MKHQTLISNLVVHAEQAIYAFREVSPDTLRQDAVADLLTALAHWCDQNSVSLPREMGRAAAHYAHQTEGTGTQFLPNKP